MGLRANETAELLFDDCFVPDENLLGGEELYKTAVSKPSGFQVAMKTFDSTRPIVAAMAIGIARAAYEYTLDIVRREYPKSGQLYTIAAEILAEAEQEIAAARYLTWEAAWKADIGLANAKEAAMCKAYAGQMALDVCAKCLEILGPVGLDGHIVEKLSGFLLIIGIFSYIYPQFSTIFGVLTIFLSILSIMGALGGFIIGTIIGIIAGALCIAWDKEEVSVSDDFPTKKQAKIKHEDVNSVQA